MKANFTRYADIDSIVKNDDGTIVVTGYASSGAVDSDGEVITPEAMKAAIPDYMKFGAVREMHGKSAAGTALEAEVQEDGRTSFSALVVDPIAIKKVESKVYKGFSIGGKVLDRDGDTITGLKLIEVSLVDRPANPEALITMYKSEEVEEKPAEEVVAEAVETETVAEEVNEEAVEEKSDQPAENIKTIIVENVVQYFKSNAEDFKKFKSAFPEFSEVEKAGSKFSSTTKAALADIHKSMNDACAKMAALGYDDKDGDDQKDDGVEMAETTELNKSDDLEKSISALKTDLEKAMSETKELKDSLEKADARIKELESKPADGKAIIKAVSKQDDVEKDDAPKPPPEGTKEYVDFIFKTALSNPI